jgi:hypothetical protein
MKITKLIPALVLTTLCVPLTNSLAQKRDDVLKERDVLIEKRVEALQEVEARREEVKELQEKIARDVEQNVKNVERQVRVAQARAGRDGKVEWAAGEGGGRGGDGHNPFTKAFGLAFANSMESPLIVSSKPLDAAALSELREDIAVMGKLLTTETADNHEDAAMRRAMGIAISWLPGGGGPEHLYVEGHGVILQTSVRFPLTSPKKEEPEKPAETPKNSAWESARKELFGGTELEESDMLITTDRKEEFDPERVERLKKNILKALANASNFRRLDNDETVTAVVRSRGGSNRAHAYVFKTAGGGPGKTMSSNSGSGDANSTMTIRIKKGDADALAGGKITEEEFQKRARIAIY